MMASENTKKDRSCPFGPAPSSTRELWRSSGVSPELVMRTPEDAAKCNVKPAETHVAPTTAVRTCLRCHEMATYGAPHQIAVFTARGKAESEEMAQRDCV